MPETFKDAWSRLRRPGDGDGLAASPVRDTNCWIFKDYQGALGFLMSGVPEPSNPPKLSHIEMVHLPEKMVHEGDSVLSLRRCLEIHLDPSCDADLLVAILDRMADHEPSGRYTTDLLMTVIGQLLHLVKRPRRPPRKEEVIGAWGELMLLHRMTRSGCNPSEAQRRFTCWEAEGNARDIIDFRFPHIDGGIAIEAKTSTTGREHHINGTGQITVPESFETGLLASIAIRETDGTSGHTCAGIVTAIEESFLGDENERAGQMRTLHSKLEMRGQCCYDERFSFILPDGGIKLFEMGAVPRPSAPADVSDMEWTANLENVEPTDGHPLVG